MLDSRLFQASSGVTVLPALHGAGAGPDATDARPPPPTEAVDETPGLLARLHGWPPPRAAGDDWSLSQFLQDPDLPIPVADRVDPALRRACETAQTLNARQAAGIRAIREQLRAGLGAPPFDLRDATGLHYCYRDRGEVLELRPHLAFRLEALIGEHPTLAGEPGPPADLPPSYRLHLHGPGVLAQCDGHWIDPLDATFLEGLDAAWLSGPSHFRS